MKKLKEKYNIKVEWQVLHSPETNMLDLRVWMSVQSKVEDLHRRKVMHKDVLARSVDHEFWSEAVRPEMLKKVHERWKTVLDLILKGNRTNDYVEKNRGLKAKLENETSDCPNSDDKNVIQSLIEEAVEQDNLQMSLSDKEEDWEDDGKAYGAVKV